MGEIPFEFIVVDDNSPDGTAEVVREMARQHPMCAASTASAAAA
jgi:glycosyltransferase involved in cell wall biosynthesis